MTRCLSEAELLALLETAEGGPDTEPLESHLEECARCQQRLERLSLEKTPAHWRQAPLPTLPEEANLLGFLNRLARQDASPDPEPAAPLPRVSGYEVLGEIGRGGMGVVYQARHETLKRLVALKMLLADRQASPRNRARFHREAEAAARLQHPHIVQLYETGEAEGHPYLALEFIDGGSVKDRFAGTPQPPAAAAWLVETVARAVHHAHGQGIVHRDLKPANILLSRTSGDPKVADFGLAKMLAGEEGPTHTGEVLGTPAYMAPEQAASGRKVIGPAADVYALGAILYELLTGRPPFLGDTPIDVLLQVVHQEPIAVTRLRHSVPRDLETICHKCLRKEPSRRYASAWELAEDLAAFREGRPTRARPAGPLERFGRWCRRNPTLASASGLAAGALVTVAVVATAFALHASRTATALRDAHQKTQEAYQAEQVQHALAERRLAEQDLERGLAACQRPGGAAEGLLWLARAAAVPHKDAPLDRVIRTNLAAWSREVVPIRAIVGHQSSVTTAAFSPDGRTVLTAGNDHTARLWDAATGVALGEPLRHGEQVRAAVFSVDGKWVATASWDRTARVWNAATGQPAGPVLPHQGPVHLVAFSPDGRTLLTGGSEPAAHLWDVAAGKVIGPPLRHQVLITALAFSPTGQRVLTVGGDRTAQFWDPATGVPVGKPIHLPIRVREVTFTRDGKKALVSLGPMRPVAGVPPEGVIRIWSAEGQPLGSLVHPPFRADGFVLSPDDKQVAVACGDRSVRLWDLATGKEVGVPLLHPEHVRWLAFSPNGKALLTSCSDRMVRLWDLAAGTLIEPALAAHDNVTAVTFSPNGKTILAAGGDGSVRLWNIGEQRNEPPALACGGLVYTVAFSPDGRQVASGTSAGAEVWDRATGREVVPFLPHPGGVKALAFSPDGKTIATGNFGNGQLHLWEAATGRRIGSSPPFPFQSVQNVTFSPDGRTVLASYQENRYRLFAAGTGKELALPKPLPDWAQRVPASSCTAFGPEGQTILSRDGEGTVWFREQGTGTVLLPGLHHPRVAAVAISSDGKMLLTGGADGRLWDAATGRPLGPALRHAGLVLCVAFTPDSKAAATGSAAGTIRIWEVPEPAAGTPEQLTLSVQVRTGLALDEHGEVRFLDPPAWLQACRRLAELGGTP